MPWIDVDRGRIEELLERVSYKPNWAITYAPNDPQTDNHHIYFQMQVTDSYHPEQSVWISKLEMVPAGVTDNEFFDWVKRQILALEKHEFDEWFKVDGVAVNDPHRRDHLFTGQS